MPDTRDQDVCYIGSTLDEAGGAACLMEWGTVQALLSPSEVLATARDLMAAAIQAETDIALVQAFREDVGADNRMLGEVLTMVRGHRAPPSGKVALRIEAVAGAKTGKPYVHIGRGSMKGELTPDEAREMATVWTQVAVAAQIDVRLRRALAKWDRLNPEEVELLFTYIQEAGGA